MQALGSYKGGKMLFLGLGTGLGSAMAMFRCEKINVTEDRAVLHVALRAPRGASITREAIFNDAEGVSRKQGRMSCSLR